MRDVQISHPQGVRWGAAVLTLMILASITIAQETVLPLPPAQPITQVKTQDDVQLKLETDRQTIGVADRFRRIPVGVTHWQGGESHQLARFKDSVVADRVARMDVFDQCHPGLEAESLLEVESVDRSILG